MINLRTMFMKITLSLTLSLAALASSPSLAQTRGDDFSSSGVVSGPAQYVFSPPPSRSYWDRHEENCGITLSEEEFRVSFFHDLSSGVMVYLREREPGYLANNLSGFIGLRAGDGLIVFESFMHLEEAFAGHDVQPTQRFFFADPDHADSVWQNLIDILYSDQPIEIFPIGGTIVYFTEQASGRREAAEQFFSCYD